MKTKEFTPEIYFFFDMEGENCCGDCRNSYVKSGIAKSEFTRIENTDNVPIKCDPCGADLWNHGKAVCLSSLENLGKEISFLEEEPKEIIENPEAFDYPNYASRFEMIARIMRSHNFGVNPVTMDGNHLKVCCPYPDTTNADGYCAGEDFALLKGKNDFYNDGYFFFYMGGEKRQMHTWQEKN